MISENSFLTDYTENNHPAFLIIPFRTEDILRNAELSRRYTFDLKGKLEELYPGKYITLTSNGRKALELALEQNPQKSNNQNIFIQTTSDNLYISSCVTKVIEKKNSWHRRKDGDCDSILINHEFGYTDGRAQRISKNFWIEDCAFSFNSKYDNGERCGSYGSCSVFSFSKFFPIQFGGFLTSNHPVKYLEDRQIIKYVSNVVGFYLNEIEHWSTYRREIYNYYMEVFSQLGCSQYLKLRPNDVPGVFLFRTPIDLNLQLLKEYYWKRGIQCSVFYGEQAFYLPLNQFTEKKHIDYFADIFNLFLKINE